MGKIGKKQLEKEMMEYFNAITEKPVIFVEVVSLDRPKVVLSVENMIVLFLLESYELYPLFTIKALLPPKESIHKENSTVVYESQLFFQEVTTVINSTESDSSVSHEEDLDRIGISGCKKPSVHMLEKKMHVAGLSAVLRFLLKFACRRHNQCENELGASPQVKNLEILDKLLGYQRGCLQACAESSIWTKFCEVDMIETVRTLQAQLLLLLRPADPKAPSVDGETEMKILSPGLFELPKDLLRLEYHLTRPVRIHNFRKRIQKEKGKEIRGNNQTPNHQAHHDVPKIRMNEVQEQQSQPEPHPGQISHDFAEGPDFTLADLLLFPYVDLALHVLGEEIFRKYLPKVLDWQERVRLLLPSFPSITFQGLSPKELETVLGGMDLHISEVPQESLYKSDPLRYKAKLRLFTKQEDIEGALSSLSSRGIQPFNFNEDKIPPFQWDSLPLLVHPEGGQLPPSRIEKKSHQLSNLALMVLKVFEENYESTGRKITIVDFCSGGGHLGILLAYLLPKVEVVLVENKEESLRRAESRVKALGLPNISFFQCNLDYYTGHFEIGVALHACGTATDLVLWKCVQRRASFVCCPCCYGAIQSNHMLHYPRSSGFLKAVNDSSASGGSGLFSLRHYFVLGHAADQTHDEANEKTAQGKVCMRMIDTDRCFHAQENDYRVFLRRMQPSTASPKNHILVGVLPPSP